MHATCRSRRFLTIAAAALLVSIAALTARGDQTPAEPNLETAIEWWPDLTDFWTPVGWKHHRFRYNVFFDGTIYADPSLSQTAKQWEGQGIQIRTVPRQAGAPRIYDRLRSERYALEDDRRCIQGWTDDSTPVLWTEWSTSGLLLRQHVFAHSPGGSDVETGLEPLFAWVRLSVHEACPGLPVPEKITFCLQLNAPHVTTGMFDRHNITMHHQQAAYPRALTANPAVYDPNLGLRLVEPDGKVRLAVVPGADAGIGFLEAEGTSKDPLVHITLDSTPGTFVDLLVPMVPTDPEVIDSELALGYDAALAESDRFWSKRPATAATIDVPETYINDTIRQFERFAEVLSERVPETGKNMTLSGSLSYVKVWATPTGKMVSMFLDPMGYHDLAGEYLEPFIDAQGTRKPPSSFLEKHPGFLGSPEAFQSVDWMADHGSLLFAIANHALLSSDTKVKARYVEPIIKACEFIRDARRATGHDGVQGILPPARYSDAHEQTQGVWSDGWNYKGLVTACRFLKQIDHPRATEFTEEAEDYKKTYLAAFRKAASDGPQWTDRQGNSHPLVPTSLHGAVDETLRHHFYLDTGPLQLVFAGLMEADDPLMQSALKWFREGPIHDYARYNSNFMQVAFLAHEMSSCIPGYSWNLFLNHQLRDRQHFLEGLYSQYAGAISRQTRTVCESRGGVTGRITHADTPFFMTRLAVIDDLIAEGELHLLRICPLGWISKERETRFLNMPTEFGPVTLRWQLSEDGEALHVNFESRFHAKPTHVYLHVPPVEGLKTITVNGKAHPAEPGGRISL